MALLEGCDLLGVTIIDGVGLTGRFTGDVERGALDGRLVRWPWLVFGRGRLIDESGHDGFRSGLWIVKKLDFLRLDDGEGGICDNVSMVRSDRDGLGRRRIVSF